MTGTWVTLLDYCTSKPPIIVFFISVMTFALTLGGLSISIELNKGKLFNPDIRSWNSFYNTVSQLGICFSSVNDSNSNVITEARKKQVESQVLDWELNETKVSFVADALFTSEEANHAKRLSIHGFIKSEDLGYSHSASDVKITITTVKTSTGKDKLCITVSGSFDLLPNAKTPQPLCNRDLKKYLLEEVTFLPYWKVENKEFCDSGQFGKLTITEKDELNVYISDSDTSLIQLHILFTSSVLCVAMTAILLCAMFGRYCKREKNINLEADKTVFITAR